MNWAALAAVASIVGVLTSLCIGAFVYGKLTQQVKDGRERTDEHTKILRHHAEKLEDHGTRITRLEERRSTR